MTLPNEFKALVVTETQDNQFIRSTEQKKIDDLPEGDVVVQVLYSSLNYKDVLSATGNRGVICHLEDIEKAITGEAGTEIVK